MLKRQKYPPPRMIAVDVDGTLQFNGKPNLELIKMLKEKKDEGYQLMLWSSRGEANSMRYAEKFDLVELFDFICSKPGFIIDDQGWNWIKYTRRIRIEDSY